MTKTLLLLLSAFSLSAQAPQQWGAPAPAAGTLLMQPDAGKTAHYGTAANGAPLPDILFTPGVVLTTDAAVVCVPGYSKTVRHTSGKLKNAVYRSYGIKSHKSLEFEIDHSISLELGGADVQANLWPQPYEPRPGAHEKDTVENELRTRVCAGTMTLREAQHRIRTDWTKALD